jgi:RimJ/RimL family protein N-acetyltransferase
MTGPFQDVAAARHWIEVILCQPQPLIFTVSLLQPSTSSSSSSTPAPEAPVIGIFGLSKWDTLHFVFDPNYWGKGYCTEALLNYLPVLWESQPFRESVGAAALEHNTGCKRVLEKCGFAMDVGNRRAGRRPTVLVTKEEEERRERERNRQKEKANEEEEKEDDEDVEIVEMDEAMEKRTMDELKKSVEQMGLINAPAIPPTPLILPASAAQPAKNTGRLLMHRLWRPEEYDWRAVIDEMA